MGKNIYSRLSLEEKEEIKRLTLSGKSLRDISKIMNFAITTIYYHVRKFKPKLQKDFVLNLPDEKIGELIGAFAGDGSFYFSSYNYKIRYALCASKDQNYALYLIELLKRLNLNPFLIKKKDEDCINILINSKAYIEFIKNFLIWNEDKTLSVKLKGGIERYSNEFLKGFVRGLMDTDGYVESYNIGCGCISENLIKNLSEILNKFEIPNKVSKKIRENRKDIFILRTRKKELKHYFDIIGFSNSRKFDKLKAVLKI